ncbi:MAG TPA: tetratricopeptide repeat protein [Terracidiphilus sp.]|nr:tetratricopeptide repeat protein [Terracidiphilus sp.]
MKKFVEESEVHLDPFALVPNASTTEVALPDVLGKETSRTLQRMFRDPNVLEEHERRDLIAHLRQAVELAPAVPEVRVLLGMALSVNLEAQEAMEVLREAVAINPDCYIARLKFGELLMRLRVCDQAAEHTQRAAQLASNAVQSELARRQAATIRTMRREGVERGFGGMMTRLTGFGRKARRSNAPVLVGSK